MKKNSLTLTSFFSHSTISTSSSATSNSRQHHHQIQGPKSKSNPYYYYSQRRRLFSHFQLGPGTEHVKIKNLTKNSFLISSDFASGGDFSQSQQQNARRCPARIQHNHQQKIIGHHTNTKSPTCTYNNTILQFLPSKFETGGLLANFGLINLKRRSMSVYSPVGSPPSPCGSLTSLEAAAGAGEGHDDIVTLSSGFNRRNTLRRRLSTICDSPPPEQEKDKDGMPMTAMPGLAEQQEDEEGQEGEGVEGLIPKGQRYDSILTQLEKVIQYRGRNISHIIVEKAVKELCTDFDGLDESEKLKFFNLIAEKYSVDHLGIARIAMSLAECKDENQRLNIHDKLRAALIPQYQWLFSQIGRLEGGVKFLVDVRTDLLEIPLKFPDIGSFHLKSMNSSLKDLIAMWFAVGFLSLERVTWKSPCDMLQKISEYEAVHPMRNWTDLKRRVGAYRRCFVFTHGSMPLEPVVVLHTALTDHIPSSIATIVTNSRMRMSLDGSADMGNGVAEDPDHISATIFYSITSTQKGLAGIELGNYLIKQVVKEVQKEFPKMNIFSSLSPIPGFRSWLLGELKLAIKGANTHDGQFLFNSIELRTFANILNLPWDDDTEGKSNSQVYKKLHQLISDNSWVESDKLAYELENPIMRLCARYLVLTKRRGFALDSVANFHLKNGAVIWRLNWRGNLKAKGLKESCGIMVNYRYFLEECESNSQNYMESQYIELGDQVRHLVKLAKNEGTPSPPLSPSKI